MVREALLAKFGLRHLIGPEDAHHTVHGEGRARVDAQHPAMRHGARQQLGEHHTVRSEVLRVLCSSRDLRVEIGRGDILSNQFFSQDRPPYACCREYSAARMAEVRILL